VSGIAYAYRVGVQVVWDEDRRLGERVAPPSFPRRVIDPKRFAEHLPAFAGEQAPRDHQVAGEVSYKIADIVASLNHENLFAEPPVRSGTWLGGNPKSFLKFGSELFHFRFVRGVVHSILAR